MKYILSLLCVLTLSAQKKLVLDKNHSKVGFSIRHMMVSEVEGKFNSFALEFKQNNEKDFEDSEIEMTIDVNSVDTDNDYRDKDLRGENFFDAEKFPTIVFKSSSMKKVDDTNYKLDGKLTMKGVTKDFSFMVEHLGTLESTSGLKAGFIATATILRSDFGMEYNSVVGDNAVLLSDKVKIKVNIELSEPRKKK